MPTNKLTRIELDLDIFTSAQLHAESEINGMTVSDYANKLINEEIALTKELKSIKNSNVKSDVIKH